MAEDTLRPSRERIEQIRRLLAKGNPAPLSLVLDLLNALDVAATDRSEERAKAIARGVADDIRKDIADRRGFSGEWDATDPEIKDEIIEAWVSIVRARLRQS